MPRKPFRAVPKRPMQNGKRAPGERRDRRTGRGGSSFSPIMVMLPLAAFTAVFLFGIPGARSVPAIPPAQIAAPAPDRESATFERCAGPVRVSCVVDGDTFWYRGEKIRIADINTPEVGEPRCAAEAALGAQATGRLLALLNQGPFSLAASGRDRDQYDRLLRTVSRDGRSLGDTLVSEGLAEHWQGYRRNWC
jgi:endonuclease YncB( thermonuclease family)